MSQTHRSAFKMIICYEATRKEMSRNMTKILTMNNSDRRGKGGQCLLGISLYIHVRPCIFSATKIHIQSQTSPICVPYDTVMIVSVQASHRRSVTPKQKKAFNATAKTEKDYGRNVNALKCNKHVLNCHEEPRASVYHGLV